GGLGTLEELFEIWTWAQLGVHDKPYAVLDVAGYYAPLLDFLDHGVREGFVRPAHRGRLLVDQDPARLLDRMVMHQPLPVEHRWIAPTQR
ncbi:MAG TPA: LOG family protein, partial [Longimicrobium sp.]|nr:LOG family protein [Longimicrobium sp.]